MNRSLRAAAIVAVFILLSGCGTKTDRASAFDGIRAYELLKKQCTFGPRYPGVKGHKDTLEFIQSELKPLADEVATHTFKYDAGGKTIELSNVYAVFNPDASHFVLLCAHWDTRPCADQEIDEAKSKKPVPGANDGASGTAVLLELARIFNNKKPDVGVVMAFFDGEDYGPGENDMFIGSKEFAKNWKTAVQPKGRQIKYDYGILLDMVGDRDLQIAKEVFSYRKAPQVVDKVWAAAKKIGYDNAFLDEERHMLQDDHLPLCAAGISCIDVIDFNYAYWHTIDDTPDKCSAKSLQTVGNVISKVIYDEGARAK
ncbi:MAG: M28 family peptidase [Armatimonadota bacterium]